MWFSSYREYQKKRRGGVLRNVAAPYFIITEQG